MRAREVGGVAVGVEGTGEDCVGGWCWWSWRWYEAALEGCERVRGGVEGSGGVKMPAHSPCVTSDKYSPPRTQLPPALCTSLPARLHQCCLRARRLVIAMASGKEPVARWYPAHAEVMLRERGVCAVMGGCCD